LVEKPYTQERRVEEGDWCPCPDRGVGRGASWVKKGGYSKTAYVPVIPHCSGENLFGGRKEACV